MSKRLRSLPFVFLALLTLLSGTLFGQIEEPKTTKATSDVSVMKWNILVPFETVELTVLTPSGKVFNRKFTAGEVPMFDASAGAKNPYREGIFRYSIKIDTPRSKEPVFETGAFGYADGKILAKRRNAADLAMKGGSKFAMESNATLGPLGAQHIFGGEGVLSSLSTITPTLDFNSFGISTGGANGFAVVIANNDS